MLKTILRFLLIGAALFALRHGVDVGAAASKGTTMLSPAESAPIVITQSQVDEIRARWARQNGRPASGRELRALIRRAADEEILVRNALVLGLDLFDQVVWRRLVQNMRFVDGDAERNDAELYAEAIELGMDRTDVVVRLRLIERMQERLREAGRGAEPSEAELRDFVARHREGFMAPARVSFVHVLVSTEKRGDAAEADARALLERLRREAPATREARRLSDSALLPSTFLLASGVEIAKALGPGFARAVVDLPKGEWSGPVRSAFGFHLVHVRDRVGAEPLPFEETTARARIGLLRERKERALADGLQALRERYEVRVEDVQSTEREQAAQGVDGVRDAEVSEARGAS